MCVIGFVTRSLNTFLHQWCPAESIKIVVTISPTKTGVDACIIEIGMLYVDTHSFSSPICGRSSDCVYIILEAEQQAAVELSIPSPIQNLDNA